MRQLNTVKIVVSVRLTNDVHLWAKLNNGFFVLYNSESYEVYVLWKTDFVRDYSNLLLRNAIGLVNGEHFKF